MRIQQPRTLFPQRQHGVALFISLVLLLVLTIIGVSSVQTTSLEVRMSRNEHDTLLAFQAAESALRDAEAQLLAITSTAPFDDTNGLYDVVPLGEAENWEAAATWTGTNSVLADAVEGTAAPSRYIVEYIGPVLRDENAHQQEDPYSGAATVDRVEMFRITARGVGGTPNAQVLLQTTFGRIMD
ncbi:MAG: PilX N-terminal domain-containing pilus assembly protein [bacterium]